MQLEDDHHCFVCGRNNPHGLCIEWAIDGFTTTAEFTPDKRYQGWKGIVHGGILASLLDEAMTRLAAVVYDGAVTAEMTVRFVAPAKVGEKIFIKGEIEPTSLRLVLMKASLADPSGKIVAHATGKAIRQKIAP